MTETKSLKERTAKGLFWGGMSNGVMQLLNLVFGIFLSRLLSNSDYGMIASLAIFPAIANIFLEGGFISAIVNRKEVRHEDYNALFWFNILGGIVLYVLLFFSAPWIAAFYEIPAMTPLARLLFLSFVFSACATAPSAYFFRHLMVKERARIMMIAISISGVCGVTAAFLGWGYWAIALQTVLFTGLTTVMLWMASPWKPTLQINFQPLREMLPFSSKLFFTYIFNQINVNVFSIFLGYFYSMGTAGIYSQGNKWTTMGYSTIAGMINGVAQPVLREAGLDEIGRLRNVFRKMLRFTVFVSFPLMLGLGLIAKELILITITAKWLPCVVVMQILCVWGAFTPVSTLYSNLMNSIGRPAIYMWNTIGLGLLQLICVWGSYPYGLETMLMVFVGINIAWLFVWHYFAWRYIGLSLWDVLRDVVPYSVISGIVILVAWLAARTIDNLYLSLAVKVVVAAGLYTGIMWLLNSVVFRESLDYLFKRKRK